MKSIVNKSNKLEENFTFDIRFQTNKNLGTLIYAALRDMIALSCQQAFITLRALSCAAPFGDDNSSLVTGFFFSTYSRIRCNLLLRALPFSRLTLHNMPQVSLILAERAHTIYVMKTYERPHIVILGVGFS